MEQHNTHLLKMVIYIHLLERQRDSRDREKSSNLGFSPPVPQQQGPRSVKTRNVELYVSHVGGMDPPPLASVYPECITEKLDQKELN